MNRRLLLAGALTVAAAFTSSAPAQATTELTLLSFGGRLDEVFKDAFSDFEKANDVKINFLPGSPPDNAAKVVGTMGHPEYDLALFDNLYFNLASSKGALAKVDEKIATNYKDLVPQAIPKSMDGYPIGFYFTGLMYNVPEFKKRGWAPPTSWEDIFRPEFCNHIGLGTVQGSFGLNTLAMLAHGDLSKVPDAIKRVGTLKDCVGTLETSSSKLEEKTQLGDYLIAVAVSTRVPNMVRQGYPVRFIIPKEGSILGSGDIAVVKGAPHEELAHKAANWLLSAKSQEILMKDGFYVPANKNVPVSEELIKYGFPTPDQVANAVVISGETVIDKRREWQRLQDRVMAK
jgi:putative spermidine/putrescine transport system substrate-binding protein